ncbi:hypothetical protein V6N13_087367 [Hibiscus sabdariffa]|uniref:Uncharacterized protein n=1 Tax=Hibiscus sabdariffa TaxID=183260 RepID=A0ABR2FW07_9ROSI
MGDSERTGDDGKVGQKRSRSPTSNRRLYTGQGSTSQPAATGQLQQHTGPSSFPLHDYNPPPPRSPQSRLSRISSYPPPPPPPLNRTPMHPLFRPTPSMSPQRPSTPSAIYTPRRTSLASSRQASTSGRIYWPTTKRRKAGNNEDDDDEQGPPPAGGCTEAPKGNPGDPDMDGGSSHMEID